MASQMIAEEDLDFHMAYENEDEMGMLCREFERMRGQLEENNRRLWQMIEDERVLRAAIAMISARRLQSCGDIRKCFWNLFRKICLIKRK